MRHPRAWTSFFSNYLHYIYSPGSIYIYIWIATLEEPPYFLHPRSPFPLQSQPFEPRPPLPSIPTASAEFTGFQVTDVAQGSNAMRAGLHDHGKQIRSGMYLVAVSGIPVAAQDKETVDAIIDSAGSR